MTDQGSQKDYNIKIIEIEYREVAQHIRDSWKHITNLLRNYFFLQVLIIGTVILGGSSLFQNQPMIFDGDGGVPGAFFVYVVQKIATVALMIFGAAISYGGKVQNERLFLNAEKFIRCGAELESSLNSYYVRENNESGRDSIHQLMEKRIDDESVVSLEPRMKQMFNIAFWTWIGVALSYVVLSIFLY